MAHALPPVAAPVAQPAAEPQPATRNRLTLTVLLSATAVGIVLSAFLVTPFVPALTWAFALAVVSEPVHSWIRARLASPTVAAAIAVALVTVVLLAPTIVIVWQVGQQA